MLLIRKPLVIVSTLSAVSAVALCCSLPVHSQDKGTKKVPDAKRDLDQSTFMRRKLEASSQILEGLTTEDSALVIKGAKSLVEMSSAEKFQVQNNMMYRQFSNEFLRTAQGLVEAAEKDNFDASALKWIDTTMKCMECHKYVRGTRLAG
ncbi:MAG: hypothetical protein FJ267_00830 [Planctomycetes bacterium]|nr:hypothetical protein [Planctomycetota bacterium]